MDKTSIYYQQVSLLIRMLPVVATEPAFALKGGLQTRHRLENDHDKSEE
ncbi:hypothetical protein V5J35_004245 [Endozoicomonas sp. NE40]|uniref:Uncharacterized protein n=1 Tax=Endozoicomonas lisbonensis TaxID=3120522 RepID=A0ABV2SMQ9_9GAMM